ncbi:MAG TPA: GNAT family N-acetyltransferase [Ruminococcaceae bacterium]|nr:GNAT family N-acetyltransferase [Oscillospiraceae bacterium]
MIIETKRLVLRELKATDKDSLYKVLADSDIMKHYPYTFDEKRVKKWIAKNVERYSVFGFGLWAVCLKESGELIGDCGLTMQMIDGSILPEIGYHIRGDMQRKGYAAEAAKAVRDWTFKNTPFEKVYSYMSADNIPSQKTAMSYGAVFEKEYKDETGEIIQVFVLSKDKD